MISLPPDSYDTPEILCRHARRRVRSVARRLIGKAGFTPADREDIEQELTLRLWRGLQGFNPALGDATAFTSTILQRAANSMLRLRSSSKRGCFRTHQPVPISFQDSAGDTSDGEPPMEPAPAVESHAPSVELAHDVDVVLHSLPHNLRELAEELKTRGVSEIAQNHAVARSTIYAQVAKLRMVFVAADLTNPAPAIGHSARVLRS